MSFTSSVNLHLDPDIIGKKLKIGADDGKAIVVREIRTPDQFVRLDSGCMCSMFVCPSACLSG